MKKLLILLLVFLTIPVFSQIKIMPLGESTTEEYFGYRQKFYNLAIADGLTVDMIGPNFNQYYNGVSYDIDNAGFSGDNCFQLMSQFKLFYTKYNPDIVLLLEGTNDCGWAYLDYWPRSPIVELSSLIDTVCLKYPNAEIFVSTISPMSNSAFANASTLPGVANDNATSFNNVMPDMIALKVAVGKKIHFVDNRSLLSITDLSSDGIHPNTDGYNKIGIAFYTAVRNFMNNIPTLVEINKTNEITIYPNPVTNHQFTVKLETAQDIILNLYNSNGSKIFTINSIGTQEIKVVLPDELVGMYFLRIKSSIYDFTKKIIVQ